MNVLMTPIHVCAIWDTDGNIRPIAFCIEEDGEKVKIPIEHISRRSEEKIAGHPMMDFFCNAMWNQQQRMVGLRYDLHKHRWYLYKA
ncbi:MAG: hypothetical protein U0M15_06305 [Bacillota bacterium]|nr:hypothetical protein [Bacillota bacterium]